MDPNKQSENHSPADTVRVIVGMKKGNVLYHTYSREEYEANCKRDEEMYNENPFLKRPTNQPMKPPVVTKVDGRARILRPLRPPPSSSSYSYSPMNPSQQPTTSNGGGPSPPNPQQRPIQSTPGSTIPHSQSMPVLAAGSAQRGGGAQGTPASRPQLTLPSNTTERNVLPMMQWVEAVRKKLDLIRQLSKRSYEMSMRDEDLTPEEFVQVRKDLTEIANVYSDMSKIAMVKCRYNAIFDKRPQYKQLEIALQEHNSNHWQSELTFDKLQEQWDAKSAIERNVMCLADTFRQNAVITPNRFQLSKPPEVKFGRHVEDAVKGFANAMDIVLSKTKENTMPWKFKRISHQSFRNSRSLIEVQYCARRPANDKEFVTCMKALLILKFGILEDLIIGGPDETLYDTETVYSSQYKVYREFTNSARSVILGSSVTKFTIPGNIVSCNNYIQMFVKCFSSKCFVCRKILHQYMPPTWVTREDCSKIYHKVCLSSQVPLFYPH